MKDISHCIGSSLLSVRSFRNHFTAQSKTTTRPDYSSLERLGVVLISQDNISVNLCFLLFPNGFHVFIARGAF